MSELKKLVATKVKKIDLGPLVADIERLFTSKFDNSQDTHWIYLCVEEEITHVPSPKPAPVATDTDTSAARRVRPRRAEDS